MLGVRGFNRIISACLFLAAPARRLERMAPERFRRLAGATMLAGAAWGLVLIAIWDATLLVTWPRRQDWVVPACLCAAATVLGPYLQACLSLGRILTRRLRRLRRGAWALWAAQGAALAAMLNHAVRYYPDWPTQLPPAWAWLWPKAIHRVLLLTPLWGSWSMLALGQFHQPRADAEPRAFQFAGSIGPLAAAAHLLAPLAGSVVYLNFLYPWHFVPPAAALLGALGAGTLLVRLAGSLDRSALLATNALTQLAFLAGYLLVR